jgi:hypothetical protein
MVMGIVADCQGECLRKSLSVEIKVRRSWSEAGMMEVTLKLRKECCGECEWWQQERGHFSGSVVCMACFTLKEGCSSMQLLGGPPYVWTDVAWLLWAGRFCGELCDA